ncbi:MAG: gliding motility-associated C-terminal domain-containing protein [Bacteroidetes bacterium]|nr:gliding motility-associated C-terminal domain-containing protein [Bacteroidota bacterium]
MRKFFTTSKKLIFLLLLLQFCISLSLFATHQRAAEITYRHVSGLTYEVTLLTYTRSNMPANTIRISLPINWGDGNVTDIPRVEMMDLPSDSSYPVTYNRYVGQHTYSGPATYVISLEDPNRNEGILNIPNSVNIPLYVYAELVVNPFLGYNNSPRLLLPPVDNGCVLEPYYHNPGAYDPDGDSLSYRLVTCLGTRGLPIPGYTLPPTTNILHLDSVTGDFRWENPPLQGQYNIAILIEEWRNGFKIGSVLRDMQIIIIACNNNPPVVDPIADTCVEAGDTLTFNVTAHDPDGNTVSLTGTGGPLVLADHFAYLYPNPAVGIGSTLTTFTWQTVCNHVQYQPYHVFFKASDNSKPVNLVDIKSMQIKVVGPPPKNLTVVPLGNSIILNWDPYTCPNAKGFYIWRKADSTGFVHGFCQTGVPPYLGYVKIGDATDVSQTTFTDNNNGEGLDIGFKYCYLVDAYYHDKAESYASNEACASLRRDLPVITNVSINTTSETNGSIYLAWSKPTEIDTLLAPGPYKYVINRSNPVSPSTFILIDSLTNLNDTVFTDTLLNTKDNYYRYRIDFYNNTPGNYFLIGSSKTASSIFLTIVPTDKRLKLSWSNNVPWSNFRNTIYRQNPFTTTYDSVGSSDKTFFVDKGLINGTTYCYLVKTVGKYSLTGFIFPILNYSQTNCGIPVDNISPCPPVLNVTPDCKSSTNYLRWSNPDDTCSIDIWKYYIYYKPGSGGEFTLIDSLTNISDTTYQHQPGFTNVGCYAVIAMDSVGNRSSFSNEVCIDLKDIPECNYRFPDVFTPNGDGSNDYFKPFPFTSVEKINLTIFDRWGKIVFDTHDPYVNWDGKDRTTNQPCSDGVYFYVCDVFEITLTGNIKHTIRGSVTILR